MKAEELVTKYSQLIEQSEATRLAETVKKVEKRMKDIEKQTMTCRNELADECERHHREEQRLIKGNKQLRAQLDQATEKIEKMNTQLKDRKTELKKLEKKLKIESQTSAENAELMNKIEGLEKELSVSQKKQGDEVKKWQKETQSFSEAKKQLQQELTSAGGEIERLNSQLEEKSQVLKKLEQKIEQERRQAQNSLRESVERAKKAELNLLEFKLEMGVKLLQRAQEDCQTNIRHLDDLMKRCGKNQAYESFMNEWQKTKDKIADMINKSKKDFACQIESVKSGKTLASLPTLEVPKPPPAPQFKSFAPAVAQQQQFFEQPKQPIAPIGARPGVGASTGAATTGAVVPVSVMSHQTTTSATASAGIILKLRDTYDVPAGTESPTTMPSPVPGAVPHHINGSAAAPVSSTSVVAGAATYNGNTPTNFPYPQQQPQQQNNGFVKPAAPLGQQPPPVSQQGLEKGRFDYFFASPGRQVPPSSSAAGVDGWRAGGLVGQPGNMGNGPYQHMSGPVQQHQIHYSAFPPPPPPPTSISTLPNSSSSAGQWGVGWGYHQVVNAGPTQSPVPDKNFGMRPLSRGASSPGPQGLMDSRGSSPITATNERHKRVDTLMEQLRATFPSYSPDFLRDYVNEFRSQQPGKTLKGLSVEQALNGVVSLLLNKNPGNTNWGCEGKIQPGLQAMNLDTFAASAPLSGDSCGLCGDNLIRCQHKITSLKCRHRFHQKVHVVDVE